MNLEEVISYNKENNRLELSESTFFDYLLSPDEIPLYESEFDKFAIKINENLYVLVDYSQALDKRRQNSSYLH